MRVKVKVLVGVGGFSIDTRADRPILLLRDQKVQEGNVSFILNLRSKIDVVLNHVQVLKQVLYLVLLYRHASVIDAPFPEGQLDIKGLKSAFFDIFHHHIRY